MSTIGDIIKASRRILNIDAVGDNVSSEEMFEGLHIFQTMMDNWSNQKLATYYMVNGLYPLSPNVQVYSIGLANASLVGNGGIWTGGPDLVISVNGVTFTQAYVVSKGATMNALASQIKAAFVSVVNPIASNVLYNASTDTLNIINNGTGPIVMTVVSFLTVNNDTQTWTVLIDPSHIDAPRPVKIESAFTRLMIQSDPIDYLLEVIPNDQYQAIARKNLQTNYPQYLLYTPTFPMGTITLWPIPTVTLTLGLSQRMQFSDIQSFTSQLQLPIGYEMAVTYNLAMDMAPRYGRGSIVATGTPVWTRAKETFADIKRTNSAPLIASTDNFFFGNESGARYNIYSDNYSR